MSWSIIFLYSEPLQAYFNLLKGMFHHYSFARLKKYDNTEIYHEAPVS